MATYSVGLQSGLYVVRIHNGVRYYVGYNDSTGYISCTRFKGRTDSRIPQPDGQTIVPIAASDVARPGFDIEADGTLWVDVPAESGTRRYISRDAGQSWSELT